MKQNNVSAAAFKRLPLYLNYLKSITDTSDGNISAAAIAKFLGLGDVQVRKDLAAVSGAGKPKTGYIISDLIDRLETFLGYRNTNKAVVVGAGKLGKALLDYDGFKEYGLQIAAAFDNDSKKIGKTEKGKDIFSMNRFDSYCRQADIKIGIITVPAATAQAVCNIMVNNKIPAIWNFAPKHLNVPENIIIYNENMASSLAILSGQLNEQIKSI